MVRLTGNDGITGDGEGCPRAYVTSEESSASLEFLNSIHSQLATISSVEELREFSLSNRVLIDRTPAAWCAFELAFLDLLGKLNLKTIDQVLDLSPIAPPFKYSAILGIQAAAAFTKSVQHYLKLGMSDFKLKVSGVSIEDSERVAILKEIAAPSMLHEMRLRIDANNLWDEPQTACELVESLPFRPWAIEEPLSERTDFSAMQKIARRLGMQIILDESLCSRETLALLPNDSDCWIANVRVSKCGGLLRSIELVRELINRNVKVIIGAHVGESSILTRAAITLANTFRRNVCAQEGAFGTYLLCEDVVAAPLMFGQGGLIVDHGSFRAAGLGLS